MGAKQLAEAKAVVKNLTDVETLGATSAINTDKTGTLTMNQMMVSTLYADGSWFTVEGEGYAQDRRDHVGRGPAGARLHPARARPRASTATRRSPTTVTVVGDPTEAALVVLAAKLGVDAEETRRAYPRLAEVPFDSEYKFMATFHRVDARRRGARHRAGQGRTGCRPRAVQQAGGPLSGAQVPIDRGAPTDIDAANERMGEKGLRVLAFAARLVDDDELPPMTADPMSLTQDLAFVGMVGIIDPLRAEAKDGRRRSRSRPASTSG